MLVENLVQRSLQPNPNVNFPSNPWSQTPKETCLFRVLACTCFPLGLVHLEYQCALQTLQGPGKLITTTTTTTTPKCFVLEVAQSNPVVIRRQIHYFFHNVNCHHKPLVSTGLLSCVCAANRHCNDVIAFFRDRKFMFRHV